MTGFFRVTFARDEETVRWRDSHRVLTERVAHLKVALGQAVLDLGNAAVLLLLSGQREEGALFSKCEEAARAALKETP